MLSKKETKDAIDFLLTNNLVFQVNDEFAVDDNSIVTSGYTAKKTINKFLLQIS